MPGVERVARLSRTLEEVRRSEAQGTQGQGQILSKHLAKCIKSREEELIWLRDSVITPNPSSPLLAKRIVPVTLPSSPTSVTGSEVDEVFWKLSSDTFELPELIAPLSVSRSIPGSLSKKLQVKPGIKMEVA